LVHAIVLNIVVDRIGSLRKQQLAKMISTLPIASTERSSPLGPPTRGMGPGSLQLEVRRPSTIRQTRPQHSPGPGNISGKISCTSHNPLHSREAMTSVQRPQFRVIRGPEIPGEAKLQSPPEGKVSTTDSQPIQFGAVHSRQQSRGNIFGQVSPRSSAASFAGGEDTNSEKASTRSGFSSIRDTSGNLATQGNSSNGMELAGMLLAKAKAFHKEASAPAGAVVLNGTGKPDKVESFGDTISTLTTLLRDLVNDMSKQWEKRFAGVEEAVSNSLKIANATVTAANERSAYFLKLGEARDTTLNCVTAESGNIVALKRQVDNLETYMQEMARELNEEKAARSQAIENLVFH